MVVRLFCALDYFSSKGVVSALSSALVAILSLYVFIGLERERDGLRVCMLGLPSSG